MSIAPGMDQLTSILPSNYILVARNGAQDHSCRGWNSALAVGFCFVYVGHEAYGHKPTWPGGSSADRRQDSRQGDGPLQVEMASCFVVFSAKCFCSRCAALANFWQKRRRGVSQSVRYNVLINLVVKTTDCFKLCSAHLYFLQLAQLANS